MVIGYYGMNFKQTGLASTCSNSSNTLLPTSQKNKTTFDFFLINTLEPHLMRINKIMLDHVKALFNRRLQQRAGGKQQ